MGNTTAMQLPWLSTRAILLYLALLAALFSLVDIPPLLDLPGHIGAGAIEAAPPGSPLLDYYQWNWSFVPNLGGEVLMKLLSIPFGIEAAGWWTALIATILFVLGGLATVRTLNPRGAYAMGWAAMFLFGFPWLWGFINYLLAVGLAMLVFGASLRLMRRPPLRAALLLVSQPLLLMCHAIGGLILPLLVACETVGSLLDEQRHGQQVRSMPAVLARKCWPLLASLAFVAAWRVWSTPPPHEVLDWDWLSKLDFLMEALRDQFHVFDIACVVTSYFLVMFGALLGARWSWRQGLPALGLFAFYALVPSDINGSEMVDFRLLPLAMFLSLGLQDWSGARPGVIRMVALSGAALLCIRLCGIALSFPAYRAEFASQLKALEFVEPGSRIFVLRRAACPEQNWRMSRLDMLPSLASVRKQAWTNTHWTIPGLHMVRMKFDPANGNAALLSPVIWDAGCPLNDGRTLDAAIAAAPIGKVDYLWLVDTGLPATPPAALNRRWQWHRSALYAVRYNNPAATFR